MVSDINMENEPTVVKTDVGAKDGQNKCPKCGATDISHNAKTGKLRCNFCRHEFEHQKAVGLDTDIKELQGHIIGSGAQDIVADANDILTFKCSSCGAEVVIDTSEVTHARCHWCRNTLSVNQQIPNGAVPDMLLPFSVNKGEAQTQIKEFVDKRKFFAHPTFTQEFTTDNIMGVYLPYMVVDINAHTKLAGQGEKQVKKYMRKQGDKNVTYYDADVYDVERDFDIAVSGLTVESSADKLGKGSSNTTNNVINSIMPFDIENSVKWDANYLKGYTSEKRDTNVEELQGLVNTQAQDIARHKANDDLKEYDRGVAWKKEELDIKGQQWKAAYLPVWLYSYQQLKNGGESLLHYVAVNARTKETMGSVPIHLSKLLGVSAIIEILGIILWMLSPMLFDDISLWPLALSGFAFFFIMHLRYRNTHARHEHESETKSTMSNLQRYDKFVVRRTKLKNAKMNGANNTRVGDKNIGGDLLKSVAGSTSVGGFISQQIDDKLK